MRQAQQAQQTSAAQAAQLQAAETKVRQKLIRAERLTDAIWHTGTAPIMSWPTVCEMSLKCSVPRLLPGLCRSSPAYGKSRVLRSWLCKQACLSRGTLGIAQRLAALARPSDSAAALMPRWLGHACRWSCRCCHVLSMIKVCVMQIMELESARTEVQAEARSLAAELESLRSEGPADSPGVCHTHISSCVRSGTWLPSCECVPAESCQGPYLQSLRRTWAAETCGCLTVTSPPAILALILARLAIVLQRVA